MQREAYLCSACWARDSGRLQTACKNPENCKGLCEALVKQLRSIWCAEILRDWAQLPCAALPQLYSRRSLEVLLYIRCTCNLRSDVSCASERLNDSSLALDLTLASSSKMSLRWVFSSLLRASYPLLPCRLRALMPRVLAQWARGRLHPRDGTSNCGYFWRIFRDQCRSTPRAALAQGGKESQR